MSFELPLKAGLTTTINFDNSMSAAEMQSLIDSAPKYIPYDRYVQFQFADGTYELDSYLVWNGFMGYGSVRIYGNTGETTGSPYTTQSVVLDAQTQSVSIPIRLQGNSCHCIFRNIKVSHVSGERAIYLVGNVRADLYYNYIAGDAHVNSWSYQAIYNSRGYLYALRNTYSENYHAVTTSSAGMSFLREQARSGSYPVNITYADAGSQVHHYSNFTTARVVGAGSRAYF